MAFLAPLFLAGLAAIAIPVIVHLIQRERKNVVEFPSLMFIRKIPYQSVERRRIHNWLLLLLRAGAMILLVAAFSRPFLRVDPVQAAAALSGAREVVILLDRSASMGYADHWVRAQAEAKKIVATIHGEDKATLVLFGTGVEEVVRATGDASRLNAAIDSAAVTSDGTRYAPALRVAQSKLSASALPRKEAYLISDFQKTGWERQEEIHLPQGAELKAISVASLETTNLAVTSVKFQRASFSGEERVMVTAGLTNRSADAVKNLPVKLEIDGRLVDTRNVNIGPNSTGTATFPAVTVAAPMRATVRAGSDNMARDNEFNFVLTPSRPVSILVIQADGAGDTSLFLTTALSIGAAPPFKTDVVTPSRVTPASFEKRSLVILNDSSTLSTQANDALTRFVTQGGGLLVALGDRLPWNGSDLPLLPGKPGAAVDRLAGGGGTLGYLDYSHPIFDEFKDPKNGNFSNVRFFKYRALTPGPTDKVLARYDDGAAAMVERSVGSGHISRSRRRSMTIGMIFRSGICSCRFCTRPPVIWRNTPSPMRGTPSAGCSTSRCRSPRSCAKAARETVRVAARKPSGVVMAPSGSQVTVGEGGVQAVELAEQGFYSVRLQGLGDRRPFQVAVNLDPSESDLTPLPPAEFVATATGRAAVTTSGQSLENPELTPEDIEKKQGIWWYLFAAGTAMLLSEAVLANRLSKRFGLGLSA